MRNTRLPYVIVITLAACGDDSGGSLPLEDVPEEFEQQLCENAVACGQAPDQATCEAATFFDDAETSELQAAIDRGTITYDGSAARDCINALSDSNCTWSGAFEADEQPESCANAVRGTVAVGGACLIDEECVGGTSGEADCIPADGCTAECCMGTCTAADGGSEPIAQGQPCETFGDVPCADGLYCKRVSPDSDMATCEPQVASGACDEFDACTPPQFCNLDFATGMGTCYRPAAEGASCDPEVFLVACDRMDNWCDPADMTCKKKRRPGETCDVELVNCVDWAWCMGGTCVELPGEGEPCGGQQGGECLGDLDCSEGTNTCVAPTPDPACTSAG